MPLVSKQPDCLRSHGWLISNRQPQTFEPVLNGIAHIGSLLPWPVTARLVPMRFSAQPVCFAPGVCLYSRSLCSAVARHSCLPWQCGTSSTGWYFSGVLPSYLRCLWLSDPSAQNQSEKLPKLHHQPTEEESRYQATAQHPNAFCSLLDTLWLTEHQIESFVIVFWTIRKSTTDKRMRENYSHIWNKLK